MAYSLVAHTVSGTSSGGTTSSAIDTTGADLLVVAVASYDGASAPTLSDSKSNTWTGLTAVTNFSRLRFFYCQGATVGSGHTFSLSGTSSFPALAVIALTGSAASPFDQQNSNSAGFQTGSVTPGFANEILLAAVTDISAGSICNAIDSGFTIADTLANSSGAYFGIGLAYLIQTTAAAKNPTWSGGSAGVSAIATFQAAAGGGGGGTPVGADALHYYREHVMRGAA